MPITINGNGTISGATTFSSAATFSSAVALPAGSTLAGTTLRNGKVLQVSQANLTPTTATGLTLVGSLSITPSSASNKILVMVNAFVRTSAPSINNFAEMIVQRNPGGTNIVDQYVVGNYVGSTDVRGMAAISYLDSPNTTSAATYAVFIAPLATTVYIDNAIAGPSTMTLMEVVP